MKDIILGEIKENTNKMLNLARGKVKGKNVRLALFYDTNEDRKSYFVIIQRRILRYFLALPGTAKPFDDKKEAKEYFQSLVDKYNLSILR